MTNTTRPGYEWWDRLCALPKYSFILGPAGNSVRRVEDKVGNWIEYPYAQAVVDDAQAEINQLRQIISDCAAALGNGSGMSADVSLSFMRFLPDEIRAELASRPPAASGAAPADMRAGFEAWVRTQYAPNAQHTATMRHGDRYKLDDVQSRWEGWKAHVAFASAMPTGLYEVLHLAECALADIGDADREPGDDVAWCERRAAQALPAVRGMLKCLAALASREASPAPLPVADALEHGSVAVGSDGEWVSVRRHVRDAAVAALRGAALGSSQDWASRAALEVSADLCDRRGIKWEMEKIDEDVRAEIVSAHARIIRAAAALASPQVAPALTDEQIAEACHGIYRCDFPDGVGYDIAIGRAVLALAAPVQVAPTEDGYAKAFYEIASVLGIGARADTPENVFRNEMLPRIKSLASQPAVQPAAITADEINGKPPTAQSILEAMVDIQEDYERNAPEHRCYADSAQREIFEMARRFVAAPMQAPAAADDARDAATFLQPADYAALARVGECLEDDEGYDVPAETMKRLAELGVVRRRTGSIYSVTSFGSWLLGTWEVLPLQTTSDANVPPSTPAAKPAEEQGS